MKKLLLIDGHSILNRAFYGLPDLTNSQGLHTNAVLGFFNILMKIMEEEKPDYLTVAFDVKEKTFRHEMFAEYKGTRKAMPEELREQVPLMKEALHAMGVYTVEKAGYEADDIIGTIANIAEREGMFVSVLSGDRDLLQLATEKVKIRIPKTKKGITEIEDYHTEDVIARYGVSPAAFIDMKALMGDSSDNIPGVPGIGEKTAAKLIMEYGSIENIWEHLGEVKSPKAKNALTAHFDLARLSKVLATIKTDCELDYRLEDTEIKDLFTKEAYELFSRLEFKSLISKYFQSSNAPASIGDCHIVLELAHAEDIFARAACAERIGTACITDRANGNAFLGITLSFGEADIYWLPAQGFLTEVYLLEKWNGVLANTGQAAFMDFKQALKYCTVENEENIKNKLDTGIAAYLLNPLKDSYDYSDLARDYLNLAVLDAKALFGKSSISSVISEKPENFLKYAAYLSYIPWKSAPVLLEELKKNEMEDLFFRIEMPLIVTLYHMEQAGIRVKKEELASYGERLAERIGKIEQSIYSQVGESFNINSPKQLGEILFEKLKMPEGKKTKTGYSTAAEVLEKLAPEYPIVSDILEYRQLTKLKSTYADGLAVFIGTDDRIHSTFNQTITATGRISSTEPNLQNIPIKMEIGREIRKVFVPMEDYVFLDADYSQIELRVLAHMSGDERLIEAYQQDRDIHRITASQVFHIPFEKVNSIQRRNAKAVNFGIIYGISSFGLSQDLSISRKEAADYIEKYFEAYPAIKGFIDSLVTDAKEKGYTKTIFGRKRPIPELKSANYMQRSFGERIAMNAPIQGTAADIIKIAMIRVDKRLHQAKLRSRLILQVHDELLIEAHKEEIETVKKILAEEMERAASLKVKLEIDMHTGESWFEAK